MKSIIKIIILSIIGFGFFTAASAEKSQTSITNGLVTDTFSVTNMNCHKDANLVERSLYRLKGVKKVQVNGETIIVKYDNTKTTAKQITTAIEGTGTCEDANDKTHKAKKK